MKIKNIVMLATLYVAFLSPSDAALSNLDRKYGTNGSPRKTVRKSSNTSKRSSKPSRKTKPVVSTKREQPNQKKIPARNAHSFGTINPADDAELTILLEIADKLYTAWLNGDDQAMLQLFESKVDSATAWNQKEVSGMPAEELVVTLFDAPEECRKNLRCSVGFYLNGLKKQGLYLFPMSTGESYGCHMLGFTKEHKIDTLVCVPPVYSTVEECRQAALETFEDTPSGCVLEISSFQIGCKDTPAGAGSNADGTVKLAAAVGTWGGRNASFTDSPLVTQAAKMPSADQYCGKLLGAYIKLRSYPKEFKAQEESNRQIATQLPSESVKALLPLQFSNSVQLLNENREVSRDELYSMLETRKMRWPAKVRLESVSVTGSHITAFYVFNTFGFKQPIHIRTEFLLDRQGVVTAVGETQVPNAPRLVEGHAACTWGKTDVDLVNDAAVKAFTEPVEQGRQSWLPAKAENMAKTYMVHRGKLGMLTRQNGEFGMGDIIPEGRYQDVVMVGAAGNISCKDLAYILLDETLCFPENASIIDCGIKDFNKVEVIYKMLPCRDEEPVYLKTLFVLNVKGEVVAIGETRCYDTDPVLDPGFESVNK